MSNGKSGRKKLLEIVTAIIILIVASYLGIDISEINPNDSSNQQIEGSMMLHMIDVGQADSFLLIQDGETALIDCGTRSTGQDIVEYLKDLGITKLDYVFGTHPHEDHMGGMYDVITNFEIGKIIIPKIKHGVTSNWYIKLMKEITISRYNVEFTKVQTIYKLGDATMKIIGPILEPEEELNNYSTVLKVSFGEMDIIMTGDAEKEVEEEILLSGENIDAEIYKVGHHGSDTSNTNEFLDAITPDYALISTGNKYGHPLKSTMEKLEEREIEVYRTDENGTVIATITSDDITFSCNPGDYLSGYEWKEKNKS